MSQADGILFEIEDNFQNKRTAIAFIYSPNNIYWTFKHSKTNHQRTKDIQVDSDVDWQKQHYKSLETAYRGSPFLSFFEDDIRPFFEKKHKFYWT
jgi:hypothetical protein